MLVRGAGVGRGRGRGTGVAAVCGTAAADGGWLTLGAGFLVGLGGGTAVRGLGLAGFTPGGGGGALLSGGFSALSRLRVARGA
jgi:hypothetical protein